MPASLDREREERREGASADLERRTSWWTADWSAVTCDWIAEQAGHRLLVRHCCPFVAPPSTPPAPPCSHWGILPSLSDTEGLDQQLRHNQNHTITHIHRYWCECTGAHHVYTHILRAVETFCVSVWIAAAELDLLWLARCLCCVGCVNLL